jgi:type II secretory pathway component PulF
LSDLQSDVSSGNNLWSSLAERRVIRRADASVLASAERVGNLPWALRSVAENIERRADFRTRLLIEFLQPAVILLIGIIVGAVVIGLFLPVVSIAEGLS